MVRELIYYLRCLFFDFNCYFLSLYLVRRWGISVGQANMAVATLNIGREPQFWDWSRQQFLVWYEQKMLEEGFMINIPNLDNNRLGEAVDRLLAHLPDLPDSLPHHHHR